MYITKVSRAGLKCLEFRGIALWAVRSIAPDPTKEASYIKIY